VGIQWIIVRTEGDVVVNFSEHVLAGSFGFCTAWLAAWLSEKMCICAGDSPNTVDLPEKARLSRVPPWLCL
jgi:hypothetical protein